ncbi:MAG TPA: antibiotic biosynthesis monooxygenase family protein [Lysobacter sp.]|jgi:heme-degrading monooxygenase HmoA|nr:antibiotic biosynthesis monooxygenase family protein [Lysobacter sp.]
MIPEVLRYKIPTEQAEAFERDYADAGESLRRSPHCLGFELLRSDKDPELYLLTILWDSVEGHLQGFRQSEQFRTFLERVRAYLPNLLEMEHYRSTGMEWRR